MKRHPRLYVTRSQLEGSTTPPAIPALQAAAEMVAEAADRYAELPPLTYARESHNALLGRAREVQTRVVTLLVRWFQTGDRRFRDAVLDHVRQMASWSHWSWIAMRAGDDAPDAIFDLSYGENSATLAIAYDWLYDTLTPDERDLFVRTAQTWSFASGLKHAKADGAWWFGKPDSNWNTVCAGGLGMLALALYEEMPEAEALLPRVEASIAPYMTYLKSTEGGWPEGIGYWNYGMRYAFMYLLSHERATGESHPMLELESTRRTLDFPLDFCPRGQPCSFGDVNRWSPLPFHYAAADRLGAEEVKRALTARIGEAGITQGSWPDAAEWLLLHDGMTEAEPYLVHGARLYPSLDWGVLGRTASDMQVPYLYLSVRGGTTEVPHGHRDLLSFHCIVDDERLIVNLGPDEYLDTTFSSRRDEIFEITPASKNTVLINGVGITQGSDLDATEIIRVEGANGVRMDATTAMGEMRDAPAASFCGRLFLLLDESAALVLDRIVLTHPGRVESRLHTYADVIFGVQTALVQGESAALRLTYAATVPGLLTSATTAPTTPTAPSATVLRWCTADRAQTDVVMATLLSPDRSPDVETPQLTLKLEDGDPQGGRLQGGRLQVDIATTSWQRTFTLTGDLYPKE